MADSVDPSDSYDPSKRLDPELQAIADNLVTDEHAGFEDEFLGTLDQIPGESPRGYAALLEVARMRPHEQRHPQLAQRLEIKTETLRHWRWKNHWSERLGIWNQARASWERENTLSREADARAGAKGLAVKLSGLIGQRLEMMSPDEITPGLIPQYVQSLMRLLDLELVSESSAAEELIGLAELTGMDDSADQLLDLASLDPKLADRVHAVFGQHDDEPS